MVGGQVGQSESNLRSNGLPGLISNGSVGGFRAYVVAPHLARGDWNQNGVRQEVIEIIDEVIANYNIDSNNVILVGASLGTGGVIDLASNLPEYFSKGVMLSGYNFADVSNITIPIVCYAGTSDDSGCINAMNNYFIPKFGEENCFWVEGNHHVAYEAALTEDSGSHLRKWTEMEDPI